ncbi:MAG: ABC transporter permease [Candidatus Rokubacteria bacterium]|nr:ABC transporter permease [Candidatus Rokubacteria bacterium]
MERYLVQRVLQGALTLLVISLIVFLLARLSGDPLHIMLPEEATAEDYASAARHWGLDKPLPVQYLTFLGNALRGDMGRSIRLRQPTIALVLERLPATLQLAGASIAVSLLIALPIGVLSAVRRDSALDYGGKVIALLGQSMPSFWLGIVLIWVFAVMLGWLPASGRGGPEHYILPAIALGWYQVAAVMRLVRSAMLDVMDSEYVKLARIKGVAERGVVWKHCLRNAAIPPLTYIGFVVAVLLTGSVVIETVFSWPGIGLLAIDAVRYRDYPLVQTIVLIYAAKFVVINLVVDVLYVYIDPRIRYRE